MEFHVDKSGGDSYVTLKTVFGVYKGYVSAQIGRLAEPEDNTILNLVVRLPSANISTQATDSTTLRCRESPPPLGWRALEPTLFHLERVLRAALNRDMLQIPLVEKSKSIGSNI